MKRVHLLAVLLPLCCSSALFCQRTTTSISGVVQDRSGAAIAKADVQAVEVQTGAVATSQTAPAGSYVLSNLQPGSYRLQISKSGFAPFVVDGVVLAVDHTVTIDATLQVGGTSETMTVRADSSQIELRSQSVSTTITPEMAESLPLNGRNVLQLMLLAPDTSPSLPSGGSSYYGQAATRPESELTFVSASGGRANSTAFYLDGGIDEDPLTQVANIFPNPDAIQEFSFNTSTYSAKFGGQGGGVVNAVTRGGTNSFHGTAFEFIRNYALNANNYFSTTSDGLRRNQYGATLGGPIQHDKMFFFGAWQGLKLNSTPTTSTAITPTQAERNGDFSSISTQLVNPRTGTPYIGNQIDPSTFDSVSQKILSYLPVGDPKTGLSYYATKTINDDNQWIGRLDRSFGNKLRLYGRYLYDDLEEPATLVNNNLLSVGSSLSYLSQNWAVNGSYIFSPNLIFDSTITFNDLNAVRTGPNLPSFTDLGMNVKNVATQGSTKTMYLAVSGYFSASFGSYYHVPRSEFDYVGNFTYLHGNHEIAFGGEILREASELYQDFYSDGYASFSSQLSKNNLVDFLLGTPTFFKQDSPYHTADRKIVPFGYVTDTWKATHRLTLTAGVRWNPWVPFHEILNNQTTVFDAVAANAGVTSARFPNLPPGVLTGGDPGVPAAGTSSHYYNIDPRLGFGLDLLGNGKSSLRGGFGMYHDESPAIWLDSFAANFPFNTAITLNFPKSLQNPYNGYTDPFTTPPTTASYPTPFGFTAYGPRLSYPTMMQWNLTFEQQLPFSVVLRSTYEGAAAYHLLGATEANPSTYIPGSSTASNAQARRKYSLLTTVPLDITAGTGRYNALVVSLQRQLPKGILIVAGYHFAKSEDEVSQSNAGHDDYTDPYNLRFDYGRSDYDIRHSFTLSSVWNLPKMHQGDAWSKAIINGWQVNGILTMRTGFPFSVLSGFDYAYAGMETNRERADITGNPHLASGRSHAAEIAQFFNTAAFANNAVGTFGDSGRNFLTGPGFVNLDFAVARTFPVNFWRRSDNPDNFEFRAEGFNLFNHPNFMNPGSTLTSTATLGKITAANSPRIMQFALKYRF